ncbi:molybdopterin oxidoreductase family protein [Vibrio sp. HN007]|uniref:molybdopterin oxidoreductase family protein n=1 Tax=Vibrio iocasae TaxID=3098914 RepID=UPI0035D456B1
MNQNNEGWIKTTCAYCGVGCGIEARPKLSGELEVRGDKSHPSNYGKLCTKGIALGDTIIHDGRLLSPIHKINEEANTLSWDVATQMVAERFTKAIEEHGPDSVAFYVSGQLLTEDYYIANKLIKGFMGTSNIDSNSRLCMASSVVGHKRAFGTDTVPVCYEDLEQAEMVVLVGSNLAWCHPVLFQRLRSAKQNNPDLKVVVVDPRETNSCEIADEHLALDSGSDVALFNGLLSYLSEHNCLDWDFISSHTNNFVQTFEAANNSDVADITGLTEERLSNFYSDFASIEKVVTIYSQGVNQSSSGSDKVNSIINCHLATGKIGKEGCGPFSVTGQPNAMGGREVGALANTLASHMEFENPEHIQLVSDFWKTDNLATKPGLKAVDLFNAMAEGKIKAVWIMATNPMVSLPDSDKIKQALGACPFVVVSDCIEDTETTRMADLVLPAQGWSEKSGTVTNSERRISRQRRVMPSPGLAKPDWWIISQVAQKMGFADAFSYRHEGEIFREYARLSTVGNLNRERDFNLIGLTQLDDMGYSKLAPQQWPVLGLQQEIVNQRFFSDNHYFTGNHKANFVPVHYSRPLSNTTENYPLLLNSGRTRDQWHTMSRTGLSARLGEHKSEPYVQINQSTAKSYGIENGQLARVHNNRGECIARAEISGQVADNQVFLPIHWNNLTAKNSKPCEMIAPFIDDASGQPEFKHTPVAITPCRHSSCAVFVSREVVDLNELDYWARQKIEQGYLYRIESAQGVFELAQYLKTKLNNHYDRIATFESGITGSDQRYVTVRDGQVVQAFTVQSDFDLLVSEELADIYSQDFDEKAESEFLVGQPLNSVA